MAAHWAQCYDTPSTAESLMTVEQLITVLCGHSSERRVVVRGQEWGLSDVGDVQSCRLAFAPAPCPDLGCWMPHLLHRTDMHRERCVVIWARPSTLCPTRRESSSEKAR